MIRVKINIDINHPSEETFRFISNFENNPIWQSGMQECRFITDGPFGIGTRYAQKAHFLGMDINTIFEVTEYEPNKMVKAVSVESTFPISFTRIVEGDGMISRVRAVVEGDPKGVFKLGQPLMKVMVNHAIQKDYRKLKDILEGKEEAKDVNIE